MSCWMLRCANGEPHTEHGEVLTAEDYADVVGAGEFMDEPRDLPGNPWPCGPHTPSRVLQDGVVM